MKLNVRRILMRFIIGIVIAANGANVAQADELHRSQICNGCTYQEYIDAAKRVAPRLSPKEIKLQNIDYGYKYYGYATIMDFKKNTIHKFSVTFQVVMNGMPGERRLPNMVSIPRNVHEIEVNTEFRRSFEDVLQAKSNLSYDVEIPESIAVSGWDLVGAGYVQNQVIDYYRKNTTFFDELNLAVSSLVMLAGKITNIGNIEIPVKFSDGSIVYFKYEGDVGDDAKLVFLRGVDGEGNNIYDSPEVFDPYNGGFKFTVGSDTLNSFLRAASRYGTRINLSVPVGVVTIEGAWICENKDKPGEHDLCD